MSLRDTAESVWRKRNVISERKVKASGGGRTYGIPDEKQIVGGKSGREMRDDSSYCIERDEGAGSEDFSESHGSEDGEERQGRGEGQVQGQGVDEDDALSRSYSSDISVTGDSSNNRKQEYNYCDMDSGNPSILLSSPILSVISYPVLLSLHGMGSTATSQVRTLSSSAIIHQLNLLIFTFALPQLIFIRKVRIRHSLNN